MTDFQRKVLEFSYETEDSFKESIEHEQMGSVKKDRALGELIKNYLNSNYQREKTRPYIKHLQNQVSLIDTFFNLTDSLRSYNRFNNYVKLLEHITILHTGCPKKQGL